MPTALYGVVLLMASIAYWVLARRIIAAEGEASLVARAIGRDGKGIASTALYAIAIPLAFVQHWVSLAIYVLVALTWLIPDRRIERVLAND